MTSHTDVAEAFVEGRDATGHNMRTFKLGNGVRVIEGYDWAAYAAKKGNKVVVFGWRGYSVTTSKHMTLISRALAGSNLKVGIHGEQIETRELRDNGRFEELAQAAEKKHKEVI